MIKFNRLVTVAGLEREKRDFWADWGLFFEAWQGYISKNKRKIGEKVPFYAQVSAAVTGLIVI